MRTEEYFQERARRADRAETLRILSKAGKGNPPLEGDELPPDRRQDSEQKTALKKPVRTSRKKRK